MSLFGSLLDNMAQNALGGSLLGDALPNTQSQPQGGLLGAPAPAAQSQQFQPSPQQQQQMRSQFLMHIGAALQQGQPIASGVQNYQQGMAAQLQAAKQAQTAQNQQRIMGAFSQEMQAAGTDPKAQQAVIAKYAPYVPPATLKDMVSMTRIETPKAPEVKAVVGNGTMAVMTDGTTKKLSDVTPQEKLQAMGNGNVFDPQTGLTGTFTANVNGKPQNIRQNMRSGQYIDQSGQPLDPKALVTPYSNKALTPAEQQDQDIIAQYAAKNGVPVDQMTGAQRQAARDSHTQAMAKFNAAQKIEIHNAEQSATSPASGGSPQGNWAQPLPGALEAYAQAIKDNRMTGQDLSTAFPSRGKEGQQARAAVMARATYLNGGTAPDFAGANATRKNETSSQNMQVQQAIQNMDSNMGLLGNSYGKLGLKNGLTGTIANPLIAGSERAHQDANIAAYDTNRETFVKELAIVLGKGSATVESNREAEAMVPHNAGPDKFRSIIDQVKQESGNRQNSLTSPFKYGTGTPGIQQPTAQAPGVPQIGQMFNGAKVLSIKRIK